MIRLLLALCFVVLLLGGATGVRADDVPYAADSLPVLASDSRFIVQTDSFPPASKVGETRRAGLYEVQVKAVLKGDLAVPSRHKIAVLRQAGSLPATTDLDNALLFLNGPLTAAQAADLEVRPEAEERIYQVAIGSHGIKKLRPESDRYRAVADYLNAVKLPPEARSKAALDWADESIRTGDVFLQRSGMFEALRFAPNNPRVVTIADAALDSEQIDPADKEIAITALKETGLPAAIQPLTEFAREAADAHPELMRSALEAIAAVPQGQDALRGLSNEKHAIVAPAARSTLESIQRANRDSRPKADSARHAEIDRLITSRAPTDRLKGLDEAGKYSFSDDIFASIKNLIESDLGPAEKQGAIRVLAKVGKSEGKVADYLKTIALKNTYPEPVRKAAIIGLGKMETGITQGALKEVIGSLKPEESRLKSLARLQTVQ